MTIDMNTLSFFSGGMSIVLGFIAIALSVYFYTQAKNSEKETSNALERIKAQTETLQKITAKQMNQFIKHATEQRPIEEILTIISSVKNIPDTNMQLQLQQNEIAALTTQAVEGYIGSYYYSAVANCVLQYYLPDVNRFDDTNEFHVLIKAIIDISSQDFNNLTTLLGKVNSTLIQNSPVYSYYTSAEQFWKPLVKDSATCFVDKQQGDSQGI
jgi:hypothetical protein